MKKLSYTFSDKTTRFYFDADFSFLEKLVNKDTCILITDENIFEAHKKKFDGWNAIVLNPGEEYKTQSTVDEVIEQLISFEADRKTFLVGVGGGVVTDLTGYIAAVYMRGLPFGFIPTSVLAMVDAAVGGKNGIDVGLYKNIVGTVRQPEFLLYDFSFLRSLPQSEWINGFAEIIKHGCIKDAKLFKLLESMKIKDFQKDLKSLGALIQKNVQIKASVVQEDEFEKGERRLLNFGHTLGHAIENIYELSHGQAISIGMTAASRISEQLNGFKESERVMSLLDRYGLPTRAEFDKKKAMEVLKMDKKKVSNAMNYVLLEKIGKGTVLEIPLQKLEELINQL
ncbi:MAG: 3-dehydroquinate synthase [Chitinophagaceae bacterium]|nr:3-dehydroquinate synthase [Chitinophagaceae bacterium]